MNSLFDNFSEMSFKIVIIAVAVCAYQVNAQVGGFVRPFATGFTNGLAEMAKPFVQFGQSIMSPASEYAQRYPSYISQLASYPSKVQAAVYEGYDTMTAGVPGASYFQGARPPVVKPQPPYYQFPTQVAFPKPNRPYPTTLEESADRYRPSTLISRPEMEIPVRPYPSTLEESFDKYRPSTFIPKPEVEMPNPVRPFPSTLEESFDKYRPSTLIPKPEVEMPRPSTLEESVDKYSPSNLIATPDVEVPKPADPDFEIPKPAVKLPVDSDFEVPTLQAEDSE